MPDTIPHHILAWMGITGDHWSSRWWAHKAAGIVSTVVGGVHMVGVLKGAFVFMADLVRRLDLPVTIDFLALSSYAAGTTTSGEVKLLKDLDVALAGRHVIVVEDIVDTGLTLSYLHEILRARGPASLRTACLLSKPSRRKVGVAVEYIGFTIEDRFVVGYGLDYAEQYRHLPYIGALDE